MKRTFNLFALVLSFVIEPQNFLRLREASQVFLPAPHHFLFIYPEFRSLSNLIILIYRLHDPKHLEAKKILLIFSKKKRDGTEKSRPLAEKMPSIIFYAKSCHRRLTFVVIHNMSLIALSLTTMLKFMGKYKSLVELSTFTSKFHRRVF